jgi:two-component system, NtrC family, response regulator AtoC
LPKRILIVDDESLVRWSLRERMTKEGYEVLEAPDGQGARQVFSREPIDLALMDLRLPDADGLTLMKQLRDTQPGVPIIIITAYSSVSTAVEAIKLGAFDYVAKPFDMDELAIVVGRAMATSALQHDLSLRIREEKEKFGLRNIVGASPAIQDIINVISKLGRNPTTTILLRGESGTGKDLVARVIHYESERANKIFMNVVCTAIPDSLLESELFGHEKGAFTDAKKQKKGLFELADGGTVFLDEIGDTSPALQAKLLHVLEYKAFKRVGGSEDLHVDVRIIAATNRDLEYAMEQASFREDLYYRFNVFPILIPPLRERREDIPLLAEHFLGAFCRETRRGNIRFSTAATQKMVQYAWPGNVRELRNVVERALLLVEGDEIAGDDILLGRVAAGAARDKAPAGIVLPPEGCSLDDVEKTLVRQALERTNGNRTRAAELLGVSRDQVRYKVEKYGFDANSQP